MFSSQQTVQVWVSSHVCVYGWFAWGHRCVDRQSKWFYLVVKWKLFQKYFTLCYRLLRGWRTTCNIKRPGLSEPWRCYWCPAQWRCESSESDPDSEVYMKESKTTSWKTSKLSVKAESSEWSCFFHNSHCSWDTFAPYAAVSWSCIRFTPCWIHTLFIHSHLHLCKKLFKTLLFLLRWCTRLIVFLTPLYATMFHKLIVFLGCIIYN